MSRSKLPVVVLLLAGLVLAAWLLWPRPETAIAPRATEPAASDSQPTVEVAAAGTSGAPASADEPLRTAVAADLVAAGADGRALVRITTRTADGEAIGGVMVDVSRLHGNRILPSFGRGLTDDQGRIEFAGVEPGKLRLTSDRRDYKNVDVTAGLNEVDFEVKAGVDVQGRVLDPGGAPVADAIIWLQTASTAWDGGRVLGQSNAGGTFALANVPANCSIGAFARGFAPSALLDLDVVDQSSPPARVELTLQPGGGELTGRVTNREGAPIAGAQVAAGARGDAQYTGGRVIEAWSIRCVETDAAGRFTLVGLRAGSTPVAARAEGFGIWRGDAQVGAGQTTTLDVRLERSAVLFGTVTDKGGAPEADARVSAFDREPGTHFLAGGQIDFDETFGNVETLTDARGAYRLEGVTAGTAWLFAQRKAERFGGVSVALERATLALEPGSEQRWDAVIDVGRSVAGVVRFRDGYPIPHLFITLHDERTGEDLVINSDKEGTFRFLCLADSTYEIRVQPPFDAPKGSVPPRRGGVLPDQGPVEIQVEYDKPVKEVPGTVIGRVADAGARIRNPAAATVTLHSDGSWFRPGIAVEGGNFRVGDIKPCRFRMILEENDTVLACSDWHDLPAGATVDVGVLTTEPGGAVRIRAARTAGSEDFEPKLYLRRDGDPRSTTIALGRRDEVLAENLTPGDYEVSGYFKGMVGVKATTTVTVGQTTDLQIDLRAGASGKVDVWWPENHTGSKRRGYRVVDASGKTVQEYDGLLYTSPIRPYELRFTLAAGRYHLAFWSDDGLRGELDFVIPANLEPPELRLDLK